MSFLKKLFGSAPAEPTAEQLERERMAKFEILKYDGVRAKKAGEVALAVRLFNEALTLQPDDMETCSYLAEVYLLISEPEKALPLLQRLAEHDPQNMSVLMALAQAAARMKAWQTVTEVCQKAFLVDDKQAAVYYMMGRASHGQGDNISAVAMYTKALTLDDGLADAYRLRARVLCEMGQYAEALKDADALLALDEEAEEAWLLKGDVEARLGHVGEARQAYGKTRALNPFNREAVFHEAGLLVAAGDLQAALVLYDEALALEPDCADMYKARGNVKLLMGDKDGSLEDVKKALELAPDAGKEIDGSYTNLENRMENQYKRNNPYGF